MMDFQESDRRIASRYQKLDFSMIAKGFGVEGIGMNRPGELRTALRKALDSTSPVVVDVAVND